MADPRSYGFDAESRSNLTREDLERLAVVLGVDEDVGAMPEVPLLWHWAFFTRPVPATELGADGHWATPARPGILEPRRMWAGGQVQSLGPLQPGVEAVRRSTVARSERKVGRSGAFVLVTLEHIVEQRGTVVIKEQQELVYRAPGEPLVAPAGEHIPDCPEQGWVETTSLNAVDLFRFSAVTFNSHRIHYDRQYAASEGYPALVVHGPLTALLLAQSCRRRLGPLHRFEFRAMAPLFADAPFSLVGEPGDKVGLRAIRNDGAVAMFARAWPGRNSVAGGAPESTADAQSGSISVRSRAISKE